MAAETKIVISNIPPHDGEYELDFTQAFSTREWRWIKKITEGEIRPAKFEDDLFADPDFIVSLAVIAMFRAKKITAEQVLEVAEQIGDAPFDEAHITVVAPDEAEVEEIPPASTTEPPAASGSGSVESDIFKKNSGGNGGNSSRSDSDPSEETLSLTGATRSDTSSGWPQTRSVT